jgi:hypothetical protein
MDSPRPTPVDSAAGIGTSDGSRLERETKALPRAPVIHDRGGRHGRRHGRRDAVLEVGDGGEVGEVGDGCEVGGAA